MRTCICTLTGKIFLDCQFKRIHKSSGIIIFLALSAQVRKYLFNLLFFFNKVPLSTFPRCNTALAEDYDVIFRDNGARLNFGNLIADGDNYTFGWLQFDQVCSSKSIILAVNYSAGEAVISRSQRTSLSFTVISPGYRCSTA